MDSFLSWFHRCNRAQLFQCFALATYIYILTFYVGIDRIPFHLPIILAFAFVLDMTLYRIHSGHWRFAVSPFIAAMSIYLMTRTRFSILPYLVAVTAGIGGKYVFRNTRSHVFNPGNLGTLTAFALMPQLAMPTGDQWVGPIQMLFFIYALGFSVAAYAKRAPIALSYLGCLLLLTLLRAHFGDLSPFYLFGPTIGSAGVLFVFHMITDPKTTPSPWRQQAIMGASVALLDFLFRWAEIFYAPLLALAIVCTIYSFIVTYADTSDTLGAQREPVA